MFNSSDKIFDINILGSFIKLLTDNGGVVIFHSFEQYANIKKIFEENGMICKDKFIWHKTNPMPRNRDRRYISDCELGSWYIKKDAKWVFNRQKSTYQSMIFNYPSESGGGYKRYHPTQKNLKLMKELVKIHTNEGETVLDPFMGSGSTGVACVNTNRNFIGIELDENYFNIAKKRIDDALVEHQSALF